MKIFKGWFRERPKNFTGIVEDTGGDKYWYLNGKWHRVDGPAFECKDGSKVWYLNGERHRVDGPAIEWSGGGKYWCLNGEYMSEEEHYKKTAYLRTTLGKLIFNEHFKLEEG
jgi:hypothetical protein